MVSEQELPERYFVGYYNTKGLFVPWWVFISLEDAYVFHAGLKNRVQWSMIENGWFQMYDKLEIEYNIKFSSFVLVKAFWTMEVLPFMSFGRCSSLLVPEEQRFCPWKVALDNRIEFIMLDSYFSDTMEDHAWVYVVFPTNDRTSEWMLCADVDSAITLANHYEKLNKFMNLWISPFDNKNGDKALFPEDFYSEFQMKQSRGLNDHVDLVKLCPEDFAECSEITLYQDPDWLISALDLQD